MVKGDKEDRRIEFGGELERELVKHHYRLTDKQWATLPAKERAIKTAVFRIINEHGDFFGA